MSKIEWKYLLGALTGQYVHRSMRWKECRNTRRIGYGEGSMSAEGWECPTKVPLEWTLKPWVVASWRDVGIVRDSSVSAQLQVLGKVLGHFHLQVQGTRHTFVLAVCTTGERKHFSLYLLNFISPSSFWLKVVSSLGLLWQHNLKPVSFVILLGFWIPD